MSKGSSTPQTTTTINKTEPDPLTQQWRTQIYGLAQDQFNQGMPGYFPGPTVVPFSDQTQAGLDYAQQFATQGPTGYAQAQGALNRSMSGFNPAMPFAANTASGGTMNPFAGMQTTAGMDTLQATARGDMIGRNPFTDRLAGQITDRVNANFARAGRFGSNAHTEGLTSGLSDLYGSIYGQERQNQLAAANSLGQFNAADLSRGGSLFEGGANRMLEGAGLLGDLYSTGNAQGMAAAGMLDNLYSYGLRPAQTLGEVGAAYEGLAGDYLADAQNRYNYEQNAGRANVSWLSDMMAGLPTYGTTTGTTTAPPQRRSALAGILGGASGGAGIASALKLTNPWAAATVGLGGLLGGWG